MIIQEAMVTMQVLRPVEVLIIPELINPILPVFKPGMDSSPLPINRKLVFDLVRLKNKIQINLKFKHKKVPMFSLGL